MLDASPTTKLPAEPLRERLPNELEAQGAAAGERGTPVHPLEEAADTSVSAVIVAEQISTSAHGWNSSPVLR